ncbi:thioesterase-like superfamily-domain-containing protein [Blyttiomyces helicus]|uniref:Thioesterase-like superfamily-domain-containing protein n=1 Tax=Blyttiomyces helicus TaxID=388810 RepID=A0A4P9VZ67_9FUNG|nr:thioesterase-like superfamily-domain-containing protein [Blyttiomyces helicus]|eukprot:RKO84602.1 thioesterase-like superfamily-domain-containing protein [Blyttiomyces helicus]
MFARASAYDHDIRVTRISPAAGCDASYEAEIAGASNVAPQGGYLLAVVFNAVLTYFAGQGQGRPVSMDVSFMNPSTTGPCRIDLSLISAGRSTTVARATLYQPAAKSPRVQAVVTMASPGGPFVPPHRTTPDWSLPIKSSLTHFVPPAGALDLADFYIAEPEGGDGDKESLGWGELRGRLCDDWKAVAVFLDWISFPSRPTKSEAPTAPSLLLGPDHEIHALFHAAPPAGNTGIMVHHVAVPDLDRDHHVVDGELRDKDGRLLVTLR